MKEIKNETYWMFTCNMDGQVEAFENGEPTVLEDRHPIKEFSVDEQGKYSSLETAILGFLTEELGTTKVPVILKQNGETITMNTDGYCDQWGQPATKTVMKRWKNGEVRQLTHIFYETIFFKKTVEPASPKEVENVVKSMGLKK